ncbi:class II fructose-bisphosphate aldolase [Aspergillus alliaceus]|uniref:class II fructose-bisphosphate aldolase n=1 Tax=Petromyces alliaceus TaxID=209559 RepID=UPI0012A48AB1|nr:ketose-bisphosphate aldolase [Aspergillus alliaceus]KAB8236250.1 ketose-bisphosphate aldolase [Aspergillus alliaceus]
MSWRTTNKTLQILEGAEKARYGILAAIAYNVEHITVFVHAAESRRLPLIIQFSPLALIQASSLVHAAAAAAKAASVSISLHLDHAQNYDQIKHIADNLPFDSIMADMSHYEKEENLERAAALREYCHARWISAEAETGRIEGGEDGIMDTGDLEEDVEDFLSAGVDYLAPSAGNLHGDYSPRRAATRYGPDVAKLNNCLRLQGVSQALNGRARLVLHGTNDSSPELAKACIRAGVTKFNVNKLVTDEGIKVLARSMERWMDIMGSSGKA